MNCSLCGLPKDTGAIGSVLPQCICHWKHTPYQGARQTELNAGGEPVKNASYWKRQHDNLLMKLNTCAIKVSELEKKLDTRTRELIGASFYEHDYKTLMAKPPLTDEDLDNLIKDAEQDGYMEMYIVGLIDGFNRARAILRKAQEK